MRRFITILGGVLIAAVLYVPILHAETAITKRATKGAPLTWTEMDGNFENLRSTLDGLSASTTQAILAVQQAQQGGTYGYQTKTAMDADLAHSAGTLAIVTNDATTDNNTYWIKLGASGTGSWQKSAMPPTLPLVDGRRYADFPTAVAAQGSTPGTLLISTALPCASDVAVPATLRLEFTAAGSIGGACTVTGLEQADPRWFGAVLDNPAADSTVAIQRAIDAAPRIVSPSGTYYVSGRLVILNRSGFTADLPGVTFAQTVATQPVWHVSGSSNVLLANFAIQGLIDSADVTTAEAGIRVDPNLSGTSAANSNIRIDGVTFAGNASNAIYLGRNNTTYGDQRNIKVVNCSMKGGLSFMLAANPYDLTVDNITIVHRNTAVTGSSMCQDEDISIWAFTSNGIDAANISVSNINIDGAGTSTNTCTGRPKIAAVAEAGYGITNIVFNNIVIRDNIGQFTPGGGTHGASVYATDLNADRVHIKNAQFANISTFNSPGIFIEARNLNFSNISLDTFPVVTGFSGYGRAIDSAQAASTAGCIFSNVSISNWSAQAAGQPILYTAESGVIFNGLRVTNSTGSIWAADKSIYNSLIIDNVTDATYGAFYLGGGAKSITVSNSIFKNITGVAIKQVTANPVTGMTMANLVFSGNGTNTDLGTGNNNIWGVTGINPQIPSTAWNGPHMVMYAYHLWVDASGRLRIKSSAPTSDTDGTIVGSQS